MLPSCLTPQFLHTTAVSNVSATLGWTESGSATNWKLQCGTSADFTSGTYTEYTISNGTPSKEISSGLSAGQTYYARVRAECGGTDGTSDWSSTYTFKTLNQPSVAVVSCWCDDFEAQSTTWEFVDEVNGSQLTNHWMIGTGINNGGSKSLYITNDGTTYAYTNNSAAMVYAIKPFTFEAKQYTFTYDWKCNGESTYDYLRVALVPVNVMLAAATSVPSGFGTSALPAGWIAIDGGSKLNLASDWQTANSGNGYSYTFTAETAGTYYVVFAWRDDTSSGDNPAAVDNFKITSTCTAPTSLASSNVTKNSATLTWSQSGGITDWILSYSTTNDISTATSETISGTASHSLSGLANGTTYYVWVKAKCCDCINSDAVSTNFTTLCPVPTIVTTASNIGGNSADISWTPGGSETSWEYTDDNGANWYSIAGVTGTTTKTATISGLTSTTEYSIKVRAVCANCESNASEAVTFTTICPVPGNFTVSNITHNSVDLSWTASDEAGWEYSLNNGTWTEITGVTGTTTKTATITGLSSSTSYTIKIRANCSNGDSNATATSNFTTSCPVPTGLTVSNITARTAVLQWTAVAGDETGWEYRLNSGAWTALTDVTGTTDMTASIGNLTPSYDYSVQIRANCSNGNSDATVAVNFTTPVACPTPSDVAAPSQSITEKSARIVWTENGSAENWVVQYSLNSDLSGATSINVPDNTRVTINGLAVETTYYVRVKAVCGGIDGESGWSEIINFTTAPCPVPTDLEATNMTPTGTTLIWTGSGEDYVVMLNEAIENINFETGDLSQASFTNDATYPFTVVQIDDNFVVKSGNGGQGSQTSSLELSVNSTSTITISFRAKVSSESGWDKAYFSIDNNVQTDLDGISGDGEWIIYTYTLTAGSHTLLWYYTKDGSVDGGDDCFYVDDIIMFSDNWTENSVSGNSYDIDGLSLGVTYLAMVKYDCGNGIESDPSDILQFELESCPTPRNVTVTDINARDASVAWDGYGDSYVVMVNESLLNANFETGDLSQASFTNDATYPFEIVEKDGSFVAKSTCEGESSGISYIELAVNYNSPVTINVGTRLISTLTVMNRMALMEFRVQVRGRTIRMILL